MKRRQAIQKTVMIAGSTALAPTMLSLLKACKSKPRLDWQPVFLEEDEARFISLMVDTWLPKTDTPGALEMKVDIFIDLVFADVYDEAAQSNVRNEILKFNDDCKERFGEEFIYLSDEDRNAMMKIAESESGTINDGVWGTAVGEQEPIGFYRSLKSMALWGYFTSEEISKNVLNYDPIPGAYLGCIPLSDVGNSWSL